MFLKRLALSLWLIGVCVPLPLAGHAAPPRPGRITLGVQHSRAVDLFFLLDNVSDWRPGWNQPEYRQAWVERFGPLSEDDCAWLAKYAEFRRRTFRDPDEAGGDALDGPDGIFAKRSSITAGADPLAAHFRRSSNVELAIGGLPQDFGNKDGAWLQAFYSHFQPRWQQVLANTQELDLLAEALHRQVATSDVAQYTDHVQQFYGVTVQGEYPVYVVWWPTPGYTAGKSRGGALYLQVNPADASGGMELSGIVFHEFAHFVSAQVDQQKKQQLSRAFLSTCPIPRESNPLAFLEEPLAVAVGNAAYAESVLQKPLDPGEIWYFDPLSDLLAKLIWPGVRESWQAGKPLQPGLVAMTARFCARIRQAAHSM